MLRPRLGRSSSSPGWALSGWAGTQPPGRADSSPGRRPLILPGWACLPAGLAGMVPPAGPGLAHPAGLLPLTRLGRCAPPGRLSQAGIPSPCRDSLYRLGWLLSTVLAGPGRDSLAQAGLFLSRVDTYFLRHMLLVQHRLQRIVPVLGRLQARTGISFTVICWSWDAPLLRPAYPSSPSQSYPQEEDKTDDMVILKTDARRQRQGLQV
jgi:hypothetical protein